MIVKMLWGYIKISMALPCIVYMYTRITKPYQTMLVEVYYQLVEFAYAEQTRYMYEAQVNMATF